ncbi:MAG: prolipoprotein diacylglyceryl transferase [Anaerolineae bacterium]|jgi:phosphatidylglycerol:prolipoprotein diacylglycerol transferase
MYPTLFTIGEFSVASYTVLLDLGLILGLLVTYLEGKRQLENGTLALDLGLWSVIGGILGGRIAYVLANWRIFSEDWVSAFRIWEGGLAFHGAILGGLLVLAVFVYFQGRGEEPVSFWRLADILTPGLALGIVFGWAACLLGGCAYGIVGEGLGYAILPDLFGVEVSRFATQAVGLGISLVLFLGVWLMRRRWPFAGAGFLLYGLFYFALQFFLEFTRGDEAIYVGPWRLAQVLDLVLALAAGVSLLVLWWLWRTTDEDQVDITEEGAVGSEAVDEPEDLDDDEQVDGVPAADPSIPEGGDEPAVSEATEGEPDEDS